MTTLISAENSIPKKLTNHNYLNPDGIIFTVYYGDQTVATINQAGKQVAEISHQVRSKDKPILILSDITKIGKINLGARKAGLDLIRNMEYQKMAIIGVNFLTQQLVNTIIIASGVGFKIKLFDNLNEAKKWLKS